MSDWILVVLYFGGVFIWATGIALYDKVGIFRIAFCVIGLGMQIPAFNNYIVPTDSNNAVIATLALPFYAIVMIIVFFGSKNFFKSSNNKDTEDKK